MLRHGTPNRALEANDCALSYLSLSRRFVLRETPCLARYAESRASRVSPQCISCFNIHRLPHGRAIMTHKQGRHHGASVSVTQGSRVHEGSVARIRPLVSAQRRWSKASSVHSFNFTINISPGSQSFQLVDVRLSYIGALERSIVRGNTDPERGGHPRFL